MPPLTPGDFGTLLRRCGTLRHLKSVHAAILRSQLQPLLAADLITHYSLLGSTSLAHSTFSSAAPHSSLFNALIRAYTDHGPPDRAVALYRQMRETGLVHDYYTYPIVIKACSALRDLETGRSVHKDAEELGFASNVAVVNALIGFYGKCGCVDVARKLFDEMPDRTVVSWSAMIGAYACNGCRKEALGMFSGMLAEGLRPNRGTFMSLMHCVSDVESADKLYQLIEKNGLDEDELVQNAAVKMYVKCGNIGSARKLFDEMPDRSLVAWNSMIEGYVETDLPMEALEVFKEMMVLEVAPDRETVCGIILACCKLASQRIACSVHGYALKNFEREGPLLENALIDLYVKCGNLGVARRLFDQMLEKDVASWNVMISGYGMHGQGKDALVLFDQMKTLVQPDHSTFSSVLSSCGLANLVDEGRQCFNSMKDFNLVPKPEDYVHMVYLLGRAGQLDEAQELIKTMPIEPNSDVWGALLSACRNHSDVELAESSARSLLELDPQNPRCCVLLSNIYKCSGREMEAEEIEALMEERAIRKIVGFSFVEGNRTVYKFLNGDRSSPQSDEIYKELERLLGSIREHGYEPNKNLVLHDVKEETIIESLHEHSEKLAIAFGFLNSEPDNEILVHKNSSICADCHTFAKLVSKVAGRVIVLRDAHRFHHFKDGTCSCGDYW